MANGLVLWSVVSVLVVCVGSLRTVMSYLRNSATAWGRYSTSIKRGGVCMVLERRSRSSSPKVTILLHQPIVKSPAIIHQPIIKSPTIIMIEIIIYFRLRLGVSTECELGERIIYVVWQVGGCCYTQVLVCPHAWELIKIWSIKATWGVSSFPFLVSHAEYVIRCTVVI